MTNKKLLLDLIDRKGLKISFICEKLGITRTSFNRKINNVTEFKSSEIKILADLLGINSKAELDRIFFDLKVE